MKNVKKLPQNKLKYIFPAILALLIVVAVICVIVFRGDKTNKNVSEYNLSLVYDDEEKILSGKEQLTYINSSDNMFETLYLHLYPNAFRQGAKQSVVSTANFENAYPNGLSYGNIEINRVYNKQNKDLSFSIEGEDSNILAIKLNDNLYPDEKVTFFIDFEVKLANINHRLGYGDYTINFGNFYPIVCVYENGNGFCKSPYHSNGDPFYSDCSNYEVEITCSSKFLVASTGNLISRDRDGERVKYSYQAKNVRDFCFTLSEQFKKVSGKVDNIEVNYYGYQNDTNLDKCIKVCKDALSTFNKMFGKYPYNQLSIVKSNFVHGGMEYPQLVLVSDQISDEKDLNYVIIHEIAHQWWYGVVGNDEYNHAWIDEGLAEYSTLLFFEENKDYGENYKDLVINAEKSYNLFEDVYIKTTGDVDKRMDRPISQFATEPEYTQCTYTKSVLMYNALRELIGKNRFKRALETLYENYKFQNISPEQLISVFVKFGGREMESFFNNWLQGKVIFMKN